MLDGEAAPLAHQSEGRVRPGLREELGNVGAQHAGDGGERRKGGRVQPPFDLGNEADREPGALGHLLERQSEPLAAVAQPLAQGVVVLCRRQLGRALCHPLGRSLISL